MQTQSEIRELLEAAGLRPQRMFGQNFLIDRNLMNKLLETAELAGGETVLEVGPATGSLTEELAGRAGRVVAVEIDRGLFGVLQARVGLSEKVKLICGDVLAGKHAISPEVLGELGTQAHLVSNLPYYVATPLVAECLMLSWRTLAGKAGGTLFDRMTFTVQQELAERLAARPGGARYGPVSVIVSLLGRLTFGWPVPASAFWPRPKVASRIVRIDFDAAAAARLAGASVLQQVLAVAFVHRRKQIGSVLRRSDTPFESSALAAGMAEARIARTVRPQDVTPQQYLVWSNAMTCRA